MDKTLQTPDKYKELLEGIKKTYQLGQANAIAVARRHLVLTYWNIGRHIVEFEQAGAEHAVYGAKILNKLSRDLSDQLGKGFSRTNLIYMRLCYLKYPNVELLSDQLTWGHLVELVSIDHDLERSFYEKQCTIERYLQIMPLSYLLMLMRFKA